MVELFGISTPMNHITLRSPLTIKHRADRIGGGERTTLGWCFGPGPHHISVPKELETSLVWQERTTLVMPLLRPDHMSASTIVAALLGLAFHEKGAINAMLRFCVNTVTACDLDCAHSVTV